MNQAVAQHKHQQMILGILGMALPATMQVLKPLGTDLWRDKAALLMTELRLRASDLLQPFLLQHWNNRDGGAVRTTASSHFVLLAEGIAATILLTGRPFKLMGVTFAPQDEIDDPSPVAYRMAHEHVGTGA